MQANPAVPNGLFGSGLIRDTGGCPLRPGGLALTETLIDLADFRPGDRVADIGCGQGATVGLLTRSGIRACGVDTDGLALMVAASRVGTAEFIVADGGCLPFMSDSLDGVISECSLSLLPDRSRTLAEWFRVLRPHGHLALGDVYSRAAEEHDGPLATLKTITDAVIAAGFHIEQFQDRSSVLADWVVQFIFQYGSLDALWGGACGVDADTAHKSKPGYYLLIAEKPVETAGGGHE